MDIVTFTPPHSHHSHYYFNYCTIYVLGCCSERVGRWTQSLSSAYTVVRRIFICIGSSSSCMSTGPLLLHAAGCCCCGYTDIQEAILVRRVRTYYTLYNYTEIVQGSVKVSPTEWTIKSKKPIDYPALKGNPCNTPPPPPALLDGKIFEASVPYTPGRTLTYPLRFARGTREMKNVLRETRASSSSVKWTFDVRSRVLDDVRQMWMYYLQRYMYKVGARSSETLC